MKLLHTSDKHNRKDLFRECMLSFDVIEETARRERVDLFADAGDFWDGPILDTAGSRFPEFIERQRSLAEIAPVVMVQGSPRHEPDGCLDIFSMMQSEHGITVLQPGIPYFLTDRKRVTEAEERPGVPAGPGNAIALIFGIPEPQKKWLLANADGAMGKAEADLAIRDAMRRLFLGLAAKRKEYPNLPCIVLYHGQVTGARTGTGHALDGGLAVSRDDLAMIGADYLALGDIHEPQQIPGLPGYYAGSTVPQDFGETHKAGCNLVVIEGHSLEMVHRVEFPHPRLSHPKLEACRTADLSQVDFDDDLPVPHDPGGERCWLEIAGPRNALQMLDAEELTQRLLASGFLPGSKVTFSPFPEETVRVAGITKQRHLRDKVRLWAENTSLEVPDRVYVLADEIEKLLGDTAGMIRERRWRINSLFLRGAIGIWKGMGRDDIYIDFDSWSPGVYVLYGKNGRGKSTVINNLHLWAQFLTLHKALKSYFRLRDSARVLICTDDVSGYRYKALFEINAATVKGDVKYYLFEDRGDGRGWQPYPGINGRLEEYKAVVAELWGSLELYLRTACITQGHSSKNPDLQEATKGARIQLFTELSGNAYLERYRAESKIKADEFEDRITALETLITAAADVDALILTLETQIQTTREEEMEMQKEHEAGTKKVATLEATYEVLRGELTALETKEARRQAAEEERKGIPDAIAAKRDEITEYREAETGRTTAETELKRIQGLEDERAQLQAEDAKLAKTYEDAVTTYNDEAKTIKEKRAAAQKRIDAAQRDVSDRETAIAVQEAAVKDPIADTCQTCGQALPASIVFTLKATRLKIEEELAEKKKLKATAEQELKTARDELAAIVDAKAPVREQIPGAARLKDVEADLAFTSRKEQEAIVSRAQEATVMIAQLEKAIADAELRKLKLADEVKTLDVELEEKAGVKIRVEAKAKDLTLARQEVTAAAAAEAAARATAEEAGRNLVTAEERRRKRDESKTAIEPLRPELDAWRFLERATGQEGIQALELDELAPGIAAKANSFLAAAGRPERIEFRTTRIGGKGSKKRQIEDFEIWILDQEKGTEQEIETLSGGEAVWIKRAINEAFAVIRNQNRGIQFLTVIQDETDGALDPESRQPYIRMLEAAHRENGRAHTILISHSTECREIADRAIDAADLPELAAAPAEPEPVEASA